MISVSKFIPGLLCVLVGGMLLGWARRLMHPRNLLDRPSGAWMTAREQQRQNTNVRVLRVTGTAVVAVGVSLLGLQLHGRLSS